MGFILIWCNKCVIVINPRHLISLFHLEINKENMEAQAHNHIQNQRPKVTQEQKHPLK